jgi:hypothetical protein
MVEYALVVALLVVVSVGALQVLSDASGDEVANEMDCVSTRPPPPSCQLRAVSTTTTDPSATTSSTVPPSTSSTTLPPTAMAWTGQSIVDGTTWRAEADVVLTNEGNPVAGATVTIRVIVTAPQIPVTYEISCVTDAAGTCAASFTVPEDLGVTITAVRFRVVDVDSPQPVDDPPPDLDFVTP